MIEFFERIRNGGYTDIEKQLRLQNSRLYRRNSELSEELQVLRRYTSVLERELASRTLPDEEVMRPRAVMDSKPVSEIDPDDLNPIKKW